MIIEEGKFYRTRDGKKARIISIYDDLAEYDCEGRGLACVFSDTGRANFPDGPDHKEDLISEWTEKPKTPIVTKTVKSLEAGVYNNVALALNEHCGWEYCLPLNNYTKDELRAAAKTLLDIADFLEGEDK